MRRSWPRHSRENCEVQACWQLGPQFCSMHLSFLRAEEEDSSVLRPATATRSRRDAGHLRIYSTPRMQLPGQKSNLGSGQRADGRSLLLSARECVSVCVCVCLTVVWV